MTPEQEQERREQQERLQVVALGIEVENFVKSPVGRYLVERGEAERTEALDALALADPNDPIAIRALQNRVKVVDTVQQWLADAITVGQATEKALVDEEVESGQA